MFFNEEDPVSIHTLAEASSQVLCDIGNDFGVKSSIRESDLIRDDKKKEWRRILFKSRNFFKHADKDKNEVLEFKTDFNDFSLFDAVVMYGGIKKKLVPETLAFTSWFMVRYPNIIREDTDLALMYSSAKARGVLPEVKSKKSFSEAIELMRRDEFGIKKVELSYGL